MKNNLSDNGYMICMDGDKLTIEIQRNNVPTTLIKFNDISEMFDMAGDIANNIDKFEPGEIYTKDDAHHVLYNPESAVYYMRIPKGMPAITPEMHRKLGELKSEDTVKVYTDQVIASQNDFDGYMDYMRNTKEGKKLAEFELSKAKLIRGIFEDMSINTKWPDSVNICRRVTDNNIVVNKFDPRSNIANYYNSVPVTNYQDYLNILDILNSVLDNGDLITAEDASSLVANYISDRDDALITMLKKNGVLDKVIDKLPSFQSDKTLEGSVVESKLPIRYNTISDSEVAKIVDGFFNKNDNKD